MIYLHALSLTQPFSNVKRHARLLFVAYLASEYILSPDPRFCIQADSALSLKSGHVLLSACLIQAPNLPGPTGRVPPYR